MAERQEGQRRQESRQEGLQCSKPDWYSDKDKGSKGKGKGKNKGKSETGYCCDCGEQGPHRSKLSIQIGPTALTKKMIKRHRGRASLKEGTLKNSRAWRRLTEKESGAGQRRAESPGGEGELTRDQEFTISQRKTKTNRCVSRSAAGTLWTWKKVTMVVDLGAAENVMPRSMFPEIGIRHTESPRMENGSEDKGRGEHQQLCAAGHVRQGP